MRVRIGRDNKRQSACAVRRLRNIKETVDTLAVSGIAALAMVAFVSLGTPSAHAQLSQATGTANQAAQEGAASQERINKLDDDTTDIEAEYKAVLIDLENLREYNEQLDAQIEDQKVQEVSLKEQIEQSLGVERNVIPLMNRMIERLDDFVKLDIPFLADRRTKRVEDLKALMKRSDATAAEKFRRILGAYQIENDYGRTIEAYDGEVDIDGKVLSVTFLKVGRIAYLYQTVDGSTTAVWDQDKKTWETMNGFREEVSTAIRIAKSQLAPDLILVPLKGPVAAE